MRYPPHILDAIRARLAISDIVGPHVQWDRRKSNPGRGDFWACCPFHQEKTPSFHADNRRGRYYCFGCQASGDHFTFLTEKEGLSFPEAVERLAADAGVTLPERDTEDETRREERLGLVEVMEMAARFFEAALDAPAGAAARGYLAERGVTGRTVRAFRVGYAPAARHALASRLAEKGVSGEQMERAGLLVTGDDIATPFSRFRDRIIFPIADSRGRVIAFGGRALSPDVPAKYLNSPDTPLFQKGRVLYNLDRARTAAFEAGTVIAVEGYMDVIALAQAGIEHAVAPLGTALTEDQLAMLWKLAPEPVLCFDGDSAGLKAAARVAEMALPLVRPGHSLRFAMLPEGQDPDDLVRHGGRPAIDAVIAAARPLIDMLWALEVEGRDLSTPERRAELDARMETLLDRIADPRVKRHYAADVRARLAAMWRERTAPPAARDRAAGRWRDGVRGGRGADRWGADRWSGRTGLRGRGLFGAGGGVSRALRASALAAAGAPAAVAPQVRRRELVLVLTVANHPLLLEDHLETFAELELATPELDRLRRQILDIAASGESLETLLSDTTLQATAVAESVDRLSRGLTSRSEWFVDRSAALEDAETGWLHTVALHRKMLTLQRELRAAEQALAEEPTEANLARLNDIREQIHSAAGEEATIEGFGTASGRAARELT